MGTRLKQRRLALRLSQEQVAWQANVAQGSISNYETGRNDVPLSVLVAICRALRMTPAELIPALAEEPVDDGLRHPFALSDEAHPGGLRESFHVQDWQREYA